LGKIQNIISFFKQKNKRNNLGAGQQTGLRPDKKQGDKGEKGGTYFKRKGGAT